MTASAHMKREAVCGAGKTERAGQKESGIRRPRRSARSVDVDEMPHRLL